MQVLVTGGSGFVGSQVVQKVRSKGWQCIESRRNLAGSSTVHKENNIVYKSISPDEDWSEVLAGVDCIVHCAARVHQMNENGSDLIELYRETNTVGTLNLAKQAASAGVKRFIFLSSIKVNGELTKERKAFTPIIDTSPVDPYGKSKFEAELALKEIAEESAMEVVIIRPPLVYGPGVKANFYSMMSWVQKGVPLPLRSINNRRSMVYLDNLVDLIMCCCVHPDAANQTFLVSDDEDVSLSSLLAMIAAAQNKRNMMFPFPTTLIRIFARLVGKSDIADRICGNLQLDISETKRTLGWKPPYSLSNGIDLTVKDFLKKK